MKTQAPVPALEAERVLVQPNFVLRSRHRSYCHSGRQVHAYFDEACPMQKSPKIAFCSGLDEKSDGIGKCRRSGK